ncbi:MAG: class I SAM-dependent methyltransferase [Dermatophilaceae bacterium]
MDAAAWDDRYADSELVWTAEPNRFVVEQVSPLPAGTAVDLACGEGRNAVWLAGRGWRTTAVDFSATGLAKGRALAGRAAVDVRWMQHDVTAWAADQPYDLVLLAYLQVPRTQRQAVVAAAASATAPGGSLLVIGHDIRNLAEGVGGPQDAALLWTPDEVAAPGFTARRQETAQRPTEAGTALDTVVHLVRS